MVNIFFTVFVVILFMLNGFGLTLHMLQLIYSLVCIMVLTWGTELSDICSGRICAGSIPFSGGGTAGVDVVDTDHVEYFDVGQVSVAGISDEISMRLFSHLSRHTEMLCLMACWFWERPLWSCYFWGLTILIFLAGTSVFSKLKSHFADVL